MEHEVVIGQSAIVERKTNTVFSNRKLGFYFFLVSEVFLFGGLIISYLVLRSGFIEWPPSGTPHLPKTMTAFNTLFLVISSLAFNFAHTSIRDGKMKQYVAGMAATILLGGLFLGIQIKEWGNLIQEGLSLKTGIYGPSFFTLTGCHGLHVLAGIIFIFIILLQSFQGIYNKEKHAGVELCGIYWHFVDIVWLVLFYLLYIF